MSGGGSSGGYDPAKLGNKLGTKLESEINKPAAVFNAPLYAGLGSQTRTGINSLFDSATNPSFSGGIEGAMGDFGEIASGQRFGMNDPGYAALRAKAGDDTLRDVNAIFAGSGRFGSGSHVGAATESLGNVFAGMDYQNFQNDIARQERAAGMLPGLFSAGQLPAQSQLAAGQMLDADAQAKLLATNDLYRRQNDSEWNKLIEGLGAFTGSQKNAGMEEQAPWWQQLLGAGLQVL